MKIAGLVTLMLLPIFTNAQSTQLGVNGSIDNSFRMLQTDPSTGVQWIVDSRNERELPVISFSSGFSFNHRFQNNLTLQTGFLYSRYGYKTANQLYTTSDGDFSTNNKILNYSDYMGIPIMAGYSFKLGSKVRLNAVTGVLANVFFARVSKAKIDFNSGEDINSRSVYFKDTGHSRFNLMSSTTIDIELALNSLFSVRFGPQFRYSITPIADAPIKERLYSIGLNAGVCYNLGKRE